MSHNTRVLWAQVKITVQCHAFRCELVSNKSTQEVGSWIQYTTCFADRFSPLPTRQISIIMEIPGWNLHIQYYNNSLPSLSYWLSKTHYNNSFLCLRMFRMTCRFLLWPLSFSSLHVASLKFIKSLLPEVHQLAPPFSSQLTRRCGFNRCAWLQ